LTGYLALSKETGSRLITVLCILCKAGISISPDAYPIRLFFFRKFLTRVACRYREFFNLLGRLK
jgi:hypothetical protein